jgi:hypothetical protein
VIEVAGVQVPRVAMLEVAHRLVLHGKPEAAGRVLEGLVDGVGITLDGPDRAAVLAVLDDPPALLGQLRAALGGAPAESDHTDADPGKRHRAAAERHESRAARHEEAAAFWARHDDQELAALARRNAVLERDAAELEHDRAAYHERTRRHGEPQPAAPAEGG